MKDIPTKMFEGHLKQIDTKNMSDKVTQLFTLLFPSFDQPFPMFSRFLAGHRFFYNERVIKRNSRFSGGSLPRGKYYSLTTKNKTHIDHTLAHELRAYRNPLEITFIDVLDIAVGHLFSGDFVILFQTIQDDLVVQVQADEAIIAIVHNIEDLPTELRTLSIKNVPDVKSFFGDGSVTSGLFKFPYRTSNVRLDNVIDLRYPDVQDWLFEKFRPLFHGKASSFWDMLPTLINPDVGGGDPSYSGYIPNQIGQTLKHLNVNALIFPSARANVSVQLEKGEIRHFEGWNLVDYRSDSKDTTIDHREKSDINKRNITTAIWQQLPIGVEITRVKSNPPLFGTFSISGQVESSAMHYKQKAGAVYAVVNDYDGLFIGRKLKHEAYPLAAWKLGRLATQWLRSVFFEISYVETRMKHLFGFAVIFDLYDFVAKLDDLVNDMSLNAKWLSNAMLVNAGLGSAIIDALSIQKHEEDLSELCWLAKLLEDLQFYWLMRHKGNIALHYEDSSKITPSNLFASLASVRCLSDAMKKRYGDYVRDIEMDLYSSMGSAELFQSGELLGIDIENELMKWYPA